MIRKALKGFVSFLVAFLSTYSLAGILELWEIHNYSVVYLIVFMAEWYMIYSKKNAEGHRWMPRRETFFDFLYGYFFSMAYLMGIGLEKSQLTVQLLIYTLIAALGGGTIGMWLSPQLARIIQKLFGSEERQKVINKSKVMFWIYFGIILISWIPVFLAYYPGIFGYDVFAQIQVEGSVYSTHHPLAHTLLLNLFYNLGNMMGSYTNGMALYTIFQMIVLALACAYMCIFLKKVGIRRMTINLLVAFMASCPIFSVLAISMTKDILFTAFVIVCSCCLGDWGMDPEQSSDKTGRILYFVSLLGMILFRNNGIYIVIILLMTGCLYFREKSLKTFLEIGIIAFFCGCILNVAMKQICHAEQGSSNEMMSVPYQQIARCYVYESESLSEDVKEKIERMFPEVERYNPYKSDEVKNSAIALEYKEDFISIYIHLLCEYPRQYFEAWLKNTQGYWYLDDITNSQIYGFGLKDRMGYFLTDTKPGFGVEHRSFFPKLEDLYERMFSDNRYQKKPILSAFFSLSLYFWLVLYALFYSIGRQNRKIIPIFGLLFGIILTIFAGPCALVRYAFPYICCLPVMYAVAFSRKWEDCEYF